MEQMIFSGSIPAVITPFTQNFEIDFDKLQQHIDFLISEGSHGLVSCGTTENLQRLVMMNTRK